VVRGDVHELTLPRGRGRVQHGHRYGVIVQADDLLSLSTILICPTSRSAPPASFHPEIALDDTPTRVLCEMAWAIDSRKLGKQVTHLAMDEMAAVDDALALVLDLAWLT
jgi:mRNA interferase MazF